MVLCGDSAKVLKTLADDSIDLVVTSPPYDDLRAYKGYELDFSTIASELGRVLKPGGVIVWVVADATKRGSETGTSFRQALYFRDKVGLNLHDTMIWEKTGRLPTQDRYYNVFEYMFIFSKGKPRALNFICDHKTVNGGRLQRRDAVINKGNHTAGEGFFRRSEYSRRPNIWKIHVGKNQTSHPAIFPLSLALDHITTWSNPGDVVLDPFCGSGTTPLAAFQMGRRYVAIDISEDYVNLTKRRLSEVERGSLYAA